MDTTNTIIIGGGQAGLALSRCLTDRDQDHLMLERGRVAERWHSERWNSMHLLTPNWMTRLPGYAYTGSDPDGCMAAPEVAHFFTRYATSFSAPILDHTAVEHVAQDDHGFLVATDKGQFRAHNIVVADHICTRAISLGSHPSIRSRQN